MAFDFNNLVSPFQTRNDQSEHSEGYDIDTIDKVQEDFYCPICLKLMRNVKQLDCGHVFCEGCLQKHLKTITESRAKFFCPVDRKSVSSRHIISVPFIDGLILSSKVKCTYGCDWVGELGNLKDHQPRCGCLPRKCQNEQCEELLPKNEIDEHLKTCNYSSVPCKYQQYGCKMKLLRLELSKHEKVHNMIERLEASNKYLHESYLELESAALDNRNELDEVVLQNHFLQKRIKYLENKHDEELKKPERNIDKADTKVSRLYFGLLFLLPFGIFWAYKRVATPPVKPLIILETPVNEFASWINSWKM